MNRENERQLTATCYIVENKSALLIWHRKYQKWQPPGGHVEEGELPHEAAIREAKEETGQEVILELKPHFYINSPLSVSLKRPFIIMLQNIPAYGNYPKHQHVDFCYLAKRADPNKPIYSSFENTQVSWFNLKALKHLYEKNLVFPDTFEIFSKLLS